MNLFLSFSSQDQDFKDKLQSHFSSLEKGGLVTIWSKDNISAGENKELVNQKRLEEADIILFLVSADFIASNECDKAVVKAMGYHDDKSKKVIPIIVRTCDWQHTSYKALEVLPKDGEPISSSTWESDDEPYLEIVKSIKKFLEPKDTTAMKQPPSKKKKKKVAKKKVKPNKRKKSSLLKIASYTILGLGLLSALIYFIITSSDNNGFEDWDDFISQTSLEVTIINKGDTTPLLLNDQDLQTIVEEHGIFKKNDNKDYFIIKFNIDSLRPEIDTFKFKMNKSFSKKLKGWITDEWYKGNSNQEWIADEIKDILKFEKDIEK